MRTSMILAVTLFAACTDSEPPPPPGARVPGPTVAKTLCPTGCPDDVLQEISEPGTELTTLHDGTYRDPQTGGTLHTFIGNRGGLHGDTHVDQESVCSLLPSEGACSLACDAEALAQLIPAGTCMTFVCELADGNVLLAGGCK